MKENLLPTLQGGRFLGPKSQLTSILEAEKLIKRQFKYCFFDLNLLDSHSFDGFKCVEATRNKKLFSTNLIMVITSRCKKNGTY